MPSLLEIKNLNVQFDTDEGRIIAVENISLSVNAGEVLGVVGEYVSAIHSQVRKSKKKVVERKKINLI